MIDRVCKTCEKPFVLGRRDECAACRSARKDQAKAVLELRVDRRKQLPMRESVVDITQAIAELTAARDEMDAIPAGLLKHQRHAALVEPLARLALVKRFVDGVLRRNGWRQPRAEETEA